jgi:ABC-type methionine transport system ATPase subunit
MVTSAVRPRRGTPPESSACLVAREQLSGGEQQRVAVARAIAKRPGVLLCGEPTGALDSSTGVHVLEASERTHNELGTTVVVIAYNVRIVAMSKAPCIRSASSNREVASLN